MGIDEHHLFVEGRKTTLKEIVDENKIFYNMMVRANDYLNENPKGVIHSGSEFHTTIKRFLKERSDAQSNT